MSLWCNENAIDCVTNSSCPSWYLAHTINRSVRQSNQCHNSAYARLSLTRTLRECQCRIWFASHHYIPTFEPTQTIAPRTWYHFVHDMKQRQIEMRLSANQITCYAAFVNRSNWDGVNRTEVIVFEGMVRVVCSYSATMKYDTCSRETYLDN